MFPGKAMFYPVTQVMDPVIQTQKLTDNSTKNNRDDGDERIFAGKHAVNADVEDAQRDTLGDRVAQMFGDKPAEKHAHDGACNDGQ